MVTDTLLGVLPDLGWYGVGLVLSFVFEGYFDRGDVIYATSVAMVFQSGQFLSFVGRAVVFGQKKFVFGVVGWKAAPSRPPNLGTQAALVFGPHKNRIIIIIHSSSRPIQLRPAPLYQNCFLPLRLDCQIWISYNHMIRKTATLLYSNRYLFASKSNYFKLFDLPYDFTEEQLKQSYLELVKKHHPDLSADPLAPEIFREVQIGYEILSDPTKRREHQLEQSSPGQSAQQSVVDEVVDRLYNKFERKDQVNDEFNFSYKMFKQHYEKVEAPKGDYQRYEGQGGDQYYAHKKEQGEKTWKQVAAAASALAVITLAYAYTHW